MWHYKMVVYWDQPMQLWVAEKHDIDTDEVVYAACAKDMDTAFKRAVKNM